MALTNIAELEAVELRLGEGEKKKKVDEGDKAADDVELDADGGE